LELESLADEDVLALFLEGRTEAFDLLVRRHEERIFALALRITGNREDALEAAQDTFVALFRRAHSFRGRARFGTWLYRIGINAASDVLRKQRRAPAPRDTLEGALPEAADPLIDHQVATRLDLVRALETLSPDYRDAVVLHDLGGASYEEIATLVDVAVGTVKSRISRGRRQLAERLEHGPDVPASKDHR
jgi:RNA polymerase sigma-70 factor (ECF subfamily)